jgi:hypothetical protein
MDETRKANIVEALMTLITAVKEIDRLLMVRCRSKPSPSSSFAICRQSTASSGSRCGWR